MRRIVMCVLAAGLVAGCGKSSNSDSKVVVSDGGNKVVVTSNNKDGGGTMTMSGNGQQFTMKSNNGNSSVEVNTNGVTGDLHLPPFVEVFPGAKVISSVHGSDSNDKGGMIAFETTSAPADVIAFYKQKTASVGFTEKMTMNQAGTMMFIAGSADNKQTVTVSASAGDDGKGAKGQVTWSGG